MYFQFNLSVLSDCSQSICQIVGGRPFSCSFVHWRHNRLMKACCCEACLHQSCYKSSKLGYRACEMSAIRIICFLQDIVSMTPVLT